MLSDKIDPTTVKILKEKKRQGMVRRERVLKEYDRLIGGSCDETLLPELADRFGITSGTVQRWLQERSKYLNPETKAINDVMVLKQMENLMSAVSEYTGRLRDVIDELEDSEEEWVDIEQSEDGRGATTKRISRNRALLDASKEMVNVSQEFFKAARAIIPQTVLNQVIDNRKAADNYSDAELDDMLRVSRG